MRRFSILILIALLAGAVVACGNPSATEQGIPDPLPVSLGYSANPSPTGATKSYDLVVKRAPWELAPGVTVPAITYNGAVPGPTIRVIEGDTLRVAVKNELAQDTSIHWHGVHVPNAMDGVPGLTQAPIRPQETFIYEFKASHSGTFMYHPHVNSVEQIDNGLYGLMVIEPQKVGTPTFDKEFSMVLGAWTVGAGPAHARMQDMGRQMTEMGAQMMAMVGQMGALGPMTGPMQGLPGRMGDLGQRMTAMGGQMGELAAQMMQADSPPGPMAGSVEELRRRMATLGQDMAGLRTQMMGAGAQAGMMEMGQQVAGIADHMQALSNQMGDITAGMMGGAGVQMGGMGGMNMNYNYFTINGKAYPATEPWSVKEGDKVRVRIVNISNLAHPMHLHGMDFKVVAKDGEPVAPANQQWMNTLSVDPGETYDIAFIADNPGNWMFHCHELHHTENDGVEPGGLMQVVKYEGYQGYAGGNTPAPAPGRPPSMPGMGH